MKSILFALLLALSFTVIAAEEKTDKESTKKEDKVEVKQHDKHHQLRLFFLDRRPYMAPKDDNTNRDSGTKS